ncbi:hypothetical protein [Methanobrevibacter sp.]|uniref:hypothetical protein n=1 Tax=Methanobrevibacter sp. TaxID=66852 RepID=UPI00388D97D5
MKHFYLFLFILFFICLNPISAMDNNDTVLAESGQIIVSDGSSIQSAIDNATAGSTIMVESGEYSEDLVIDKELSIIGQNAVLKSENVAFMILPTANNTSISGFSIILSNENATGILVNASDCKIEKNTISGGKIGILAEPTISNSSGLEISVIRNIEIIENSISDASEAGISVMAFNPVVSRNNVTNIKNKKENGTASGILVNGTGLDSEDLKVIVTDNHVSNIESANASAYGIDIRGAAVFDNLTDFDVGGNAAENVMAPVEAYGINIDVFALDSTLPTLEICDLNVSNISSGSYENASVTGIRVAITTIGQNESSDTFIHDINVNDLDASGANSAVTGMKASGVGCADIHVLNNNVSKIKASSSAIGISGEAIDYNSFKAFIEVSENNVTDINSPKSRAINVMALGNVAINKNLVYDIPGENSTFITGVPLSINMDDFNITIPSNASIEEIFDIIESVFNSTNYTINGNFTAVGNNLEGTGSETAFAVVMQTSTINYNRAVNFKNNVVKDSTKRFLLDSYGIDPDISMEELAYLLAKSQPGAENYTEEELRNMSEEMAPFLEKMFGNMDRLTSGDVDARFNWWGTNSKPPESAFKNNNGTVIYDPWLVLHVRSNPSVIDYGEYSRITADVYTDSSGADHSLNASQFFSGPRVTLLTDKGSFNGQKSVTLDWVNGQAVAYLYGDEYGLATVTAFDYDKAFTTVLIRGGEDLNDGEVTLKPTGNPLLLLFSVLMLFASVCGYKRR